MNRTASKSRYINLNHSDGTSIPLKIRRCDTFLCRFKGLMLRRSIAEDEGLLFMEKAESRMNTTIHMFFVFFSIGVVWLAADGTVVDAKLAEPFRPYYAPQAPAQYYLEGPPALLDWVRIGEKLTIEPQA